MEEYLAMQEQHEWTNRDDAIMNMTINIPYKHLGKREIDTQAPQSCLQKNAGEVSG